MSLSDETMLEGIKALVRVVDALRVEIRAMKAEGSLARGLERRSDTLAAAARTILDDESERLWHAERRSNE